MDENEKRWNVVFPGMGMRELRRTFFFDRFSHWISWESIGMEMESNVNFLILGTVLHRECTYELYFWVGGDVFRTRRDAPSHGAAGSGYWPINECVDLSRTVSFLDAKTEMR